MHVEEDEQVGGPIALILAVVALELTRRGRDRLPDLADELGRAFVTANDWALRIGRLRIEVEHILHAGDVFAIDLRNAPHVLASRLEVVFGQMPPPLPVASAPRAVTRAVWLEAAVHRRNCRT